MSGIRGDFQWWEVRPAGDSPLAEAVVTGVDDTGTGQWPSPAEMATPGTSAHDVVDFLAARLAGLGSNSRESREDLADQLFTLVGEAALRGDTPDVETDSEATLTAAALLRFAGLLAEPFGWAVKPQAPGEGQ